MLTTSEPAGAPAPPISAAEYARREGRAVSGRGIASCVVAGAAWVNLRADTAAAREERRVLRRGLGRQRVAGFVSLGASGFILGVVVTVTRFLTRPGVTSTSAAASALLWGVLALLALFAVGTGWVALRRARVAGRLIRYVDGPGPVGVWVRGPLVARGSLVPRLGGVPLLVTDPGWRRALAARNGAADARVLVAPTFAAEPALGAARVLVRAPGA